jgi:Dockerin type I domain
MPNDDQIPERLLITLREMDKGRVFVPLGRDAEILAKAKAQLAHRRKRQFIPWLAAAAALVIAAFVLFTDRGSVSRSASKREDVNHDGIVDIRDAMLLARRISEGRAQGLGWDLNQDGRVDQGDVAALAALAVKL